MADGGGLRVLRPAVRILRANANAVFLASEPQVPDQVMVTETVIADWLTKEVTDQFAAAANPNARRCYAPVTAMPLQTGACPDVVGPDDPSGYTASQDEAAFVDALDGQVPGRWFYRIEPLDAQGMPAASGAVIGVVVQGTERPAAPVLIDAYFGTEAEHKQFSAAKSADELLEILKGIKERNISLVWRHEEPQGLRWLVDAESENGMLKSIELYPSIVQGEMKANLVVSGSGRWCISIRAVSLDAQSASNPSSPLVIGAP